MATLQARDSHVGVVVPWPHPGSWQRRLAPDMLVFHTQLSIGQQPSFHVTLRQCHRGKYGRVDSKASLELRNQDSKSPQRAHRYP